MLAVTKEVVEAARENLVIRQCCENSRLRRFARVVGTEPPRIEDLVPLNTDVGGELRCTARPLPPWHDWGQGWSFRIREVSPSQLEHFYLFQIGWRPQ